MSNEALAILIQQGEREKVMELWMQVMPLVAKLARTRYIATNGLAGVTHEDLIQAGFLGFLAAVDAFDPESGYKFTTYLARHLKTAFSEAGYARGEKRLRDPLNWCDSLDRPIRTDEESSETLNMVLPDPTAAQAFENAENRVLSEEMHTALSRAMVRLSADQRAAITGLYFDGKSVLDLAEECGVSPNVIRYREQVALQAMRRSSAAPQLAAYLRV